MCAFLVLVMRPRARVAPLEYSEGPPVNAITRGAEGKRRASPSSAAIVSAVRSSMPREQRSRSTREHNGSIVAGLVTPHPRPAPGRSLPRRPGHRRGASARVRQWPALCLEPRRVALRPGLLGGGKATPVAEQEFRETMPRPQQIRAMSSRHRNRSRAASSARSGYGWPSGRPPDTGWPAAHIAAVRLDAIPGRRGMSAGAITSHGMPARPAPAAAQTRRAPLRSSSGPGPRATVGGIAESSGYPRSASAVRRALAGNSTAATVVAAC